MNEMTPMRDALLPWLTLAALGAYHGINPGMGWLFAVALGLQERARAAVVRAFAPIALGHAVSIAAVVALVAALQHVVSPTLLRMAGASALVAFGLYKLLAPMSHPRWVGMRVGFRDLTLWSFLMATAHGAGLMLVPVLLALPTAPPANRPAVSAATAPDCHVQPVARVEAAMAAKHHADAAPGGAMDPADHSQHIQHVTEQTGAAGPLTKVAAIALHTGAMFLVMALLALIVYEKVGLAILRRAWVNLDLLWAIALIGAGALTVLL